jgi:steroid delta-isomerase-like uncharacterized protein
MTVEQNKEIVRRYFEEVINQGRLAAADQLFAADFGAARGAAGAVRGPARARHTAMLFRSAFPDVHFEVGDLIAEGDVVVVRVTFEGTHRGEFLGIPPTGRHVRISGVELARLRDGKIVEEGWHHYDELQLLRQLGVVPDLPHGHGQSPSSAG